MNAPIPKGATAPAVNPDRLPAEVRASIQAQAPAFDLESPEPIAPPTPAAVRALVETIKARDGLSEAAIADAIGMKKQNFSHAKTGYRGKTLSAEQWRALQSLAEGEGYPESERETVTEPRRCRETADMFEASVDNSVADPAPFDLAEAIAQGAEITARAGELEADSDLQTDLERLAEYEHQQEPVELACFSPDEGKTADAPLVEVQVPDTLSHLPEAMRHARRWLVWKLIPNPDPAKKGRKVPFYCNGTPRNGTLDTPEDRAQLVTLAEARAALETGAYTGLGFALGPDETGHHWQGIDLDGTDTRPELEALVERLPGYVERSPSGKGWHAIGIGRDFATLGSNASGIEAYAHGRYFTVTGTDGRGDLEDIADFVTVTLSPLRSPRAKAKDTPIERPHVDTTDQMVRDLRSALASMRSDDRDLWVRLGLALKPLGDPGRALWLEWSQTSEKFDPRDAARVWESFKPEGTGPAAVFAEAQRAGWVNPAKGKTTETRRLVEQEGERHTHQTTGERGETPSGATAGAEAKAKEYPTPTPLPKLPPVPDLPLEILPNDLRGWVEDAAERARFRPDFAAVAAMSALGSVIGRQVGIRLKQKDDWTEYANVWGCVIGPPSALKSPAIQQALKPFKWLQVAADERHQAAMQGYKQDMEDFELRKNIAKKKAAKELAKDPAANVARDTTPPPEKPPERTYWTSNATAEALGVKLAENPVGLFLERDELSSLLVELEDERNATARGLYLSGWSGREGYRFDRIMRGTTYIPKFALSVFGGIQPGPLARYVRGASSGERADGLLQRFQLAVWPDPARFEYVDRHPSQAARERARLLFERADNLDAEAIGYRDQFGEDPPYVRLSPEAQGLFVEWYTDFMRHRRQVEAEGAESDPICAHFGKYPGLVGKLALILHIADDPDARAVSETTLLKALAWLDYLTPHARRIYHAVEHPETGAASLLLARVRRGELPEKFTARDIYRKGWHGLADSDAVLRACDLLQEYDWLIDVSPDWKGTGRPPAKLYAVSPAVEVAS